MQTGLTDKSIEYITIANEYLNLSREQVNKFNALDFKKRPLNITEDVVCYLISKSMTTARCALQCSERGYTQDAFMLIRSIFENLVNIRYLLQGDSEKKAVRFIEFDYWQRRNQFKLRLQYPIREQQVKQSIEKEKIKLDEICAKLHKKYGIKERWINWSNKNMHQMSDKVSLGNVYAVLWGDLSALIHGSVRASNAYIDITGEKVEFKVGPTYIMIEKCLKYLCEFMNEIWVQFNKIFNLGLEEKHQGIESRFEKLVKRQ